MNTAKETLSQNPGRDLLQVIGRICVDDNELLAALGPHILDFVDPRKSFNPKDEKHQRAMKLALERLLASGKKSEAGLLLNIHRVLTEFRGYGANEKASSDVEACFGEEFQIPDEGKIIVDFFATRNLPKIVEICERRKVDLKRIRVCVPTGVFAAQLVTMSPEKKAEFEAACAKLDADQFVVQDVNHVKDIEMDNGSFAVWFSPRTMPICPELHGDAEEQTIRNYVEHFRQCALFAIPGARVFANLAYSEKWRPLGVEMAETRGGGVQAKLTGISKSVAEAVSRLFVEELGWKPLRIGEFNPAAVSPDIDHAKMAEHLHVQRQK